MVYQNKFVAAVKVGGQILRETSDGVVSLPFGSEYSLYLKNLNSVRVLARVSIDSVDATESTKLVILPNSSIDLERFIRHGNMQEGNRFKFIERAAEIEAHRGAKVDDGIVRIEYWTERPYVPPTWTTTTTTYGIHYPTHTYYNSSPYRGPSPMRSLRPRSATASASLGAKSRSMPVNASYTSNPGITVPGSVSQQQFHTVSGFDVQPTSDVLILRLMGCVGNRRVSKALTVKSIHQCQTCGKKSKSNVTFCPTCGTAIGQELR